MENQEFVKLSINGRYLKTARIEEEWLDDVQDPEAILRQIRAGGKGADIFTFWQRLPDVTPRYGYYMETQSVAAIPVSTYENWLSNQVNKGARRAVRKAAKVGIDVRVSEIDPDIEQGIWEVFNETPVRQGRPYPYYGADLETVRKELAKDAERCTFVCAFFGKEMVGFIKLADAGQYTVPFGMVSKMAHRDKSVQNALLAKAVEVSSEKKIPYLLYGFWNEGTLNDFKENNGALEYRLPRYYIPLTLKGRVALAMGFHHGIRSRVPPAVKRLFLKYRNRFYLKKYKLKEG